MGDRPPRARADEPAEQERERRYQAGLCRDCDRRRPPTARLCRWCQRRIERNTERYHGVQGRRGPPSKASEVGIDLAMAVRELSDARALLVQLYQQPRSRERELALKAAWAKVELGARFANHALTRRGGG